MTEGLYDYGDAFFGHLLRTTPTPKLRLAVDASSARCATGLPQSDSGEHDMSDHAMSHTLSHVQSGGGAVCLLSVAELIACKKTSLCTTLSSLWTHRWTFSTLLDIARGAYGPTNAALVRLPAPYTLGQCHHFLVPPPPRLLLLPSTLINARSSGVTENSPPGRSMPRTLSPLRCRNSGACGAPRPRPTAVLTLARWCDGGVMAPLASVR
jgi:hypothetical protein